MVGVMAERDLQTWDVVTLVDAARGCVAGEYREMFGATTVTRTCAAASSRLYEVSGGAAVVAAEVGWQAPRGRDSRRDPRRDSSRVLPPSIVDPTPLSRPLWPLRRDHRRPSSRLPSHRR